MQQDGIDRFERVRRTVGWFGGPAAFLAVLLLPSGLEPAQQRLAAVFALVVVFWITEAIPLAATALLGVALTVPLGVASATDAFANFANPIIFVFLGGFLIARGMEVHGLDRRIALWVLSRSWVGDRPARILAAFGGVTVLISLWMSNTATTAMMLPIALGVLATIGSSGGRGGAAGAADADYATGLLLMIAFAASIGGMGTPVGSPTNLVALGFIERIAGRHIGFFEWMAFGLPLVAAMFTLLFVLLRWLYARRMPRLEGAAESIAARHAALGPWRAGEKAALAAFVTAVVLWTLPGILALAGGAESPAARAASRLLPEGASAILAASLLFLLPIDWPRRKFALEWHDAVAVNWGAILLFGGGLSLGTLAFDSGLAGAFGAAFEGIAGDVPHAVLILIAAGVAALVSELFSNTATANMLAPIFLAIAMRGDGSLLPTLAATLGCSLGFALPVATPPNTLVYGTGRVPFTAMLRAGLLLDVGCALLVWLGLLAYGRLF
jgi:sodium-dependent dicarboxylate transporter 2/3/5